MTKKLLRFRSWSFSSYQNWAKCPFYAMHKHLLKTPEAPSPALENGRRVHAQAEELVKQLLKKPKALLIPEEASVAFASELTATLPESLERLGTLIQDFVQQHTLVHTERKLAFDRRWLNVDYWENPWLRAAVDLMGYGYRLNRVEVVDYKTGKEYPDVYQQLDLYAACLEKLYGVSVIAKAWYTETGKEIVATYNRRQCCQLRRDWTAKVRPMLDDRKFEPAENWTCRWCYLSKEKWGPCKIA